MSFNLNKESSRFIVRTVIIYIGLLVLDFIFVATRGDGSRFKISSYAPITLYYLFILFNNRVLIKPFILDNRRYVIYVLCFLPTLILFSFLYDRVIPSSNYERTFLYVILSNIYFAFIGSATYLGWNYFREKNNLLRLNSLQKETELKQLKSQLNPHFLFNSLNNIYSYNLENNKHGNDLILKLSNLMRFIVESTDKEKISLSEELDFINDYITFEKERLGDRCEIIFSKQIDHPELLIPPLIFFPFIENAFKHGTTTISQSKIEVSLQATEISLQLVVRNTINENGAISTKTGLPNIQKRLQLLYPDKHEIKVGKDGNYFTVNLKIQMK